jgi:hypothetical protein
MTPPLARYSYDKAGNVVFQRQDQPNDPPAAPQIVGISGPRIVPAGGTVTVSVVVADAQGVGFQWQFKGADLTGETRDTLVLANVTAAREGSYTVVVTNSVGSVTASVSVYLDSTGNLLPDSWEIAHFGNLTSQRAAGDPDQDGISNLDEFLDGTDPLSPTSQRPRLIAYSQVGGSVTVSPNQLSYALGNTVTPAQSSATSGLRLDATLEKLGLFYLRFMDDILVLAPARWKLRARLKARSRALVGGRGKVTHAGHKVSLPCAPRPSGIAFLGNPPARKRRRIRSERLLYPR